MEGKGSFTLRGMRVTRAMRAMVATHAMDATDVTEATDVTGASKARGQGHRSRSVTQRSVVEIQHLRRHRFVSAGYSAYTDGLGGGALRCSWGCCFTLLTKAAAATVASTVATH